MDAANSLSKVPKACWTLEIGHKFRLLQYWRAKLSFQQNNMDGTHKLQQLRENTPEKINIFQGNENRGIRAQIHNTAKAIRKAKSDSFKKRQDHLELKAMTMVHEEDLAL
eukprot:14920003-Ditylum_brightwellii.AAC.1